MKNRPCSLRLSVPKRRSVMSAAIAPKTGTRKASLPRGLLLKRGMNNVTQNMTKATAKTSLSRRDFEITCHINEAARNFARISIMKRNIRNPQTPIAQRGTIMANIVTGWFLSILTDVTRTVKMTMTVKSKRNRFTEINLRIGILSGTSVRLARL